MRLNSQAINRLRTAAIAFLMTLTVTAAYVQDAAAVVIGRT